MNFNATDAEDALSQAMLRAREKIQKYGGKIDNLKAWLMQLTRNLCIDIIRQRSRAASGVDSLEWVGETEKIGTASAVETPDEVLEREEKISVIEKAIASLPEQLRHTFILHFYQQRTHHEIAEAQGITYDNVCKRISLARKHLKQQLSSYFRETDGEARETRESPTIGEIGETQQRIEAQEKKALETQTVSAEKENVEEVEAETPKFVETSVEPRELVSQTIQETAPVSVEKCVEEVKAEIPEFVESFVELRELVSQTITEVANRSSKLPLLSRLLGVRGGELLVLLPSSILENTKFGLTTLLIGILKVLPILKSLSQWGFMRRIWDRTLADTGGAILVIAPLFPSARVFSEVPYSCWQNLVLLCCKPGGVLLQT